ncbi:MAG: DUF3617 domain-containing protein [Sphingomonadaceae bacterium]|nr:DUF3617 domain-containing protein [Altererythrobacter sp.]MCP5394977.1 DUF3617 domain-containing protein [Sphingomonadaceae bacterium]
MKKSVIALSSLALVACSGGGPGGSDEDVQMQGGKWSNTMVIEKFEIPGAPPEAAGIFQAMVGKEQTSEECRTDEEMQKSLDDLAKGPMDSDEDCKTESMDVGGGKISGKVTCSSPTGGKATMVLDGSHTSTSLDMTMTVDMEDPTMPGGKGNMVMKVSGKRVGDCDS